MKTIVATKEDIAFYLKEFSKHDLKQITNREEMRHWFDGDWGTYWFLFKNPRDSVRVDIVHQRDNTTRFAMYTSKPIKNTNKKFFTSDGCARIITPYIPVNELIDICVKNGIEFEDKEFTYADPLYKKNST